MKKLILFMILACLLMGVARIQAQEEDSIQFLLSENVKLSGFGAPFVEFSSITDEFAVCVGGGGALMINRSLFAGAYFEGIVTRHYMDELAEFANLERPQVSFEHGGIWLGYVYKHQKAIHGGLSMKLGWGSIDLDGEEIYDNPLEDSDHNDRIFVIQPQLEVEFNLTQWFKINVGAGYRFITGNDATYLDDQGNHIKYYSTNDFNSPVGTITFIFTGHDKKK